MIILDEPFASAPLLSWMEQSQHPVLENDFIRSCAKTYKFALVDGSETARRINAGERVYTNSENALAWIVQNTKNQQLIRGIQLFKDKAALRDLLAPLNPQLFYARCAAKDLQHFDISTCPRPFVLKPSVGFCSMGVYTISTDEDWVNALEDIKKSSLVWNERYPENVIDVQEFILEGYIEGTEYALDAYFDEDGKPHILNILRHDFASPEDTSDRLYVTSADMVQNLRPLFIDWLTKVNELVNVVSFPVHVEVRLQDNVVYPIEFNPLRFAGLGGTDVSWYGYGYRTYQAFLENDAPNFDVVVQGKEDTVYSMSLLNPSPRANLALPFDYDALEARFSRPLHFDRFEVNKVGSYGFLFLETTEDTAKELDYLLHTDLLEFEG